MKILSVANFSNYNSSNTALHRHWALEQLGRTTAVDTAFKYSLFNRIVKRLFVYGISFPFIDTSKVNKRILDEARNNRYDIIWIDKGIIIKKSTLIKLKRINPDIRIVGYSPDEMTKIHNQSYEFLQSLPYYDFYITTKSYAVNDLKKLGAKEVIFVDNAYEEKFHFPHLLTESEKKRLGGDVGFIGMWEERRAESILFLAKNGVNVRVWGGGKWLEYYNLYPNLSIESRALFSEDYVKALCSFKINLCFLRKMNNDLQTTRTMEIPACKGFMLAEETSEHLSLFAKGKEADFFNSDDQLLEKVKFYLKNNELRESIAENGYKRCLSSGYSNRKTIQRVFKKILNCEYSISK